jgi:hypothetical protein
MVELVLLVVVIIIVGVFFFIIDKMCPWTDEERREIDSLNYLIWSCNSDELLKERLMSDPLAVLAEHGIDVPKGVTVKVTSGRSVWIEFSHPDPQTIETVLLGIWDGT